MIADAIGRRERLRVARPRGLAVPVILVLALALFGAGFLRDWHLPGLYMDAINPEYLIPGILKPPPPVQYIMPGNLIFGDRFPVFTGSFYMGSVKLYAALPFMKLFGATLTTFRVFQLVFGAAIVALVIWMSAPTVLGPRRAIAAGAAGLLVLDPSFVMALRTQAYACMFPLLLLLGSVLLLRRWRESARPWLRLLVSGFLYGLAVFGYFIYGFFLPALVWLLLRRAPDAPGRSLRAAVPAWLVGCVIGYLPFIAGMLLIRRQLGGFAELFDYLRSASDELGVAQDTGGFFNRVETVFTDSRRVFSGEWPWLMVLARSRTGLLESLKADALLLVPLAVLVSPRLTTRWQKRTLLTPVLLVLAFGAAALIFGSRLDGHHYTALLPLVYAAFGVACAALWPWETRADWRSRVGTWHEAVRAAVVVVAIALVGITSVRAEQDFHQGLQATGGVRLFSDAINRFADSLNRERPVADVHTPDWGFSMPVAFLSDAYPVRTIVDVEAIHQETCAGKPQVLVFLGTGNEQRFQLVSKLADRPMSGVTTWKQRDGVPVFQTARFAPVSHCGPLPVERPVGAGRHHAALRLTPDAIPMCPYLANVRAALSWSAPKRKAGVELVVQPAGGQAAVLVRGGARGTAETGPWATAGMRFSLRDAASHRELASASLSRAPCPGA